ncbi:hypothetical protein QPK32_12345 [Massilia sp. YIM B02763]|uniref:hypothetical protein n=1 Tax=Massilia sp. YIM B02763 TaxID=3050130 RepID=UPI0025B68A00|nr:hypothetical protein [Massilia sp. YIM B02763]MDN4053869.1 hypothetical protein [Massilia sp. YIM B02763]
MTNRILTTLLLWTLLLIGTRTFAADGDQVSATLHAFQVVTSGKDVKLVPTTQANPGDVIEYQVTYQNNGKTPARQVLATLPVPEGGMAYIDGTATPATLMASLDGKTFAPAPLKRQFVRNGRRQSEPVPASEYRFLRWDLGELAPGQSVTVTSRMRLGDAGKRS